MITQPKIAIIGLGYVGLPLAVEFGKKYPTVGFDIASTRIEELKNGYDRTLEVSSVCRHCRLQYIHHYRSNPGR
jgi:UDP-N-acetyl-D-galactosamine dehydrogenase